METEAVFQLRRDPSFALWLWDLYARVPALLWIASIAGWFYVVYLAEHVH